MLRWCRSSYRVSPGYGVRNGHFIRTRGEAVDASDSSNTEERTNSARTQPVANMARRTSVHVKQTPTLYYYDNRSPEGEAPPQAWCLALLQNQDFLPRSPLSTSATPTPPSFMPKTCSKPQPAILSSSAFSCPIVPAWKPIDSSRRTSASLPRPSHRPGKPEQGTPLSQLTWYLQPRGLRTTVFSESVLNQLVVLYRSCRLSGSLTGLSDENYVALVTICGSYSSSGPLPFAIRHQANISKPAGEPGKLYWDFVVEVMEDRCRMLGGSVTEVERFWRFQGLVHTSTENRNISRKPQDTVKLITEDYQALRRTVAEEAFHISYFRTVLASAATFDHPQFAGYLCDYLEACNQLSPPVAQIMLQLLVQHGDDLPSSLRCRFLAIVPSIHYRSTSPPPISPRVTARPQKSRPGDSSSFFYSISRSVLSQGSHPDTPTSATLAWVREETMAAFDSRQPLPDRWANLLLLSNAAVSDNNYPSRNLSSIQPDSKWRTMLSISILGNTLKHLRSSASAPAATISQLSAQVNTLWKSWAKSAPQTLPIEVERGVLLSFFDMVSITRNISLLEECTRHCTTRNLAQLTGNSPSICQQVVHLVATYIHSRGSCQGYYWARLLHDAARLAPEAARLSQSEILSSLLTRLLPHEFDDAYSLYQFASSSNIRLSQNAVLPLAVTLAERQKWSVVIPFLSGKYFDDRQIETVLVAALKTFQSARLEAINPRLAGDLGRITHRLYKTLKPSSPSKFPVRYFFRLLITAGHGDLAVRIIGDIFAHDPSFFTQRCVRRWLVQLVHRQCPRQAMALFEISQPHFTQPQVEDLRRKLLAALVDTGHSSLARRLTSEQPASSPQSSAAFQQTTRDKLLRLLLRSGTTTRKVRCNYNRYMALRTGHPRISRRHTRRLRSIRPTAKPRFDTLNVMSIIDADPRLSPASIRTAISILVRHGRFLAARRLLKRATDASADGKELTTMGNIILHGWLHMHQAKKVGGLRRVFGLMDKMKVDCEFKPDRTTINILTKAILANEARDNPSYLRGLFDCFVQRGYPVSESWREPGPGLFHTNDVRGGLKPPPTSTWAGQLPWVAVQAQPISVLKHVQPLYKLFIKHFHLVGDLEAAHTLVGVLKEEQDADLEKREADSRARRMGIIRKQARGQVP